MTHILIIPLSLPLPRAQNPPPLEEVGYMKFHVFHGFTNKNGGGVIVSEAFNLNAHFIGAVKRFAPPLTTDLTGAVAG